MTGSGDSLTNNNLGEPSGDDQISNELSDSDETTAMRGTIDRSLLTNPLVLRALGAIVIGFAFLLWPARTNAILARLVGAAICWVALSAILAALRYRPRRLLEMTGSLAAFAFGGFLFIFPNQSGEFLGRLIGAGASVYALQLLWRHRQSRRQAATDEATERTDPDGQDSAITLSTAASLLAVGMLLIAFPDEVLGAMISVVASVWIAVSVLVVLASLDSRTDGATSYRHAIDAIGQWLTDRPKSVDARQALYDKILYEGPNTRQRIIRFFALMSFAAIIASMGVITDSTAVVIGAMLIAPLMTPLMGMAISLVMGWPNRLRRSSFVAIGGIACAITIGIFLGLSEPTIINTATNSQILSRSSPTIADLITALAAGAAGAYGLSRPDVSDSLPGVAIAISLVPPLSVVGIAYSQGDWGAGNGALLLFATNMLAILIMGGLTFVATGVTPIAHVAANQQRVRTSLAAVTVLAAIVLAALFLNSSQLTRSLLEQRDVEATVRDWIDDDSGHQVVTTVIDGDAVSIVVIGPSEGLGETQELANQLSDNLGRPVEVNIRLVVEERLTATSDT